MRLISKLGYSLTLLCVATGCSVFNPSHDIPAPVPMARYNPSSDAALIVPKTIKRTALNKALASNQPARVVELLYGKNASPGYKQYRLFGVKPGSTYDLLGLENADIILAANGYVLHSQDKLPKFLALLPGEKRATIDIRRAGQAVRFAYTIVN